MQALLSVRFHKANANCHSKVTTPRFWLTTWTCICCNYFIILNIKFLVKDLKLTIQVIYMYIGTYICIVVEGVLTWDQDWKLCAKIRWKWPTSKLAKWLLTKVLHKPPALITATPPCSKKKIKNVSLQGVMRSSTADNGVFNLFYLTIAVPFWFSCILSLFLFT